MSKKKPASPPSPVSPPSFEESLEQLEAIVCKLEGGQMPLDDSLEQYELGIGHLGLCYKTLARVEKKVELLSGLDAQGKPLTEPFDDLVGEPGNIPTPKKRPSSANIEAARSRRSSSPPRKKLSTNSSQSNLDPQSNLDSQSNVDEGDTLF